MKTKKQTVIKQAVAKAKELHQRGYGFSKTVGVLMTYFPTLTCKNMQKVMWNGYTMRSLKVSPKEK